MPWTEEPGVHGVAKSLMTERLHFHFHACTHSQWGGGFHLRTRLGEGLRWGLGHWCLFYFFVLTHIPKDGILS